MMYPYSKNSEHWSFPVFLFFLGPNFRHKDFAKNRRMAVRVHWEKRFKLPGIFFFLLYKSLAW